MKRSPFIIGMLAWAGALTAQVKPNADWRTLKTEHFSIHFTPELEEVGRRAAVDAESAYVKLSRELHPPRGPIDIVISDDVDFSNGSATPFPTNRITVYANPPVFESALRFTDDPTELVVTHELTHIFHLDRTGGIWKPLQLLFGRYPLFFPNAYSPSWLTEGIAVYYETKLTGGGRIAGSEHRMIARSAAVAHQVPRLDQLSLSNPHFPYGYSAYAYGSLFVDYLARSNDPHAMNTFVESESRQLIPVLLNPPARRAFRKSFTSAYREWADSLVRTSPPAQPPLPGWRNLTVDGAYAAYPRWLSDSAIVYTGTPGRESYGAYRLSIPAPTPQHPAPSAQRSRVGRRNSRSPNAVLSDGSLLYSQLEFTSAYTIRSDLYVDRKRGGTTRLTHGARLATPDARADGLIVAVNIVPAGTRLALVSSDGKHVTPITNGGPDEQWSDPRWSPNGRYVAAIHWLRGGTSEVVVVDTTGHIVQTLIRERAVNAAPSWSSDGRYVYFSSDRNGTPNLYRGAFRAAFADTVMIPDVQQVSDAQTGLFEPVVSPTSGELAGVVFKADGYHVGIAPVDSLHTENAAPIAAVQPRLPPPASRLPAPTTRYSPWKSLLPRYWLPFFETALDSNSLRIGALTSGRDVVGRHAYDVIVFVPTDNSGITGTAYYRNASFGQPLIELYGSQEWTNRGCILDANQQNACIGFLRRRIRDATLALTLQRLRIRTASYLSIGGGIEARDYATDSAGLINRIDSLYRRTYYYPRLTMSLGWSNTQYPLLAISPEDGISLATTTRARWRLYDTSTVTGSVVSSVAAYKSLDLPGFAHHVIALRGAFGVEDNRGTDYFEVGGISGGIVEVLPGYLLGEGRRTFSVRGFPAATMLGIYAAAGNAEYRAPLRLPGRGLGTAPVFLDRMSVTLFGDAGAAWCPAVYSTRAGPSTSLCTQSDVDNRFVFLEPLTIGSVGAELNITAAVLSWDAPFRYRFGFAAPVVGTQYSTRSFTGYFTVGASF